MRGKRRSDPLEGLDAFVRRVMRDWNIPGAAVAVVRDGEVVLCKGYGWQDVRKQKPATPDTIFQIASVTKAFTTMLLGMLVDEGKLEWDKPVRQFMPEFALHDQVASERVTPRDLVCHRTGLPRHDNMWDFTTLPRNEVFARLKHLQPSRDLRSAYQYNNLMFMAAGVLVEKLTGKSWEDNLRERVFLPLGMSSTFPILPEALGHPRLATPYLEKRGRLAAVPHKDFTSCGPAGTICSSVSDMIQWVKLHLAKGKVGRRRLVSEKSLAEMHSPAMVVPGPYPWREIPMAAYGLGWLISVYRGTKRIMHNGAIDGFRTAASFMPEHNWGLVVLTNKHDHPAQHIIEYQIYDRLLGMEPINWNGRMKKQWAEMKAREAAEKRKRGRASRRGTRPSHAPGDYTGRYVHAGYGPVEIARNGRGLHFTMGRFSAPLAHRNYDTWQFHEEIWDNDYDVSFSIDSRGRIDKLAIPLEPSVAPIVFEREATQEKQPGGRRKR